MSFFNRHFALIAFLILFAFRLVMLLGVQPGNAPDEIGHMLMAVSLAQGKLLTLQESMDLSRYPYPIYNPLGYLPSAVVLWVGAFFNLIQLGISKPFTFTTTEAFLARLGMQFWSVLFLIFFLRLIKNISTEKKVALCSCVALVPQLLFVQAYVNLDSIGLTIFLYLLWAFFQEKERHLAFATFLLGCCKMNFFCLFLIPVFYVWFKYRSDLETVRKKIFAIIVVPCLFSFVWFVFSYFVNTREHGAFLGFNALPEIYHSSKAGFRVFSLEFLNISLNSAFGRFGWMSIRIPEFLSLPWRVLILPAGVFFLIKQIRSGQNRLARDRAKMFLSIVLLNIATHFWGSFNNDYQPQGRYILPAVLILLGYLTLSIQKRWRTNLCIFMCISSLLGIVLASKRIEKPPGLIIETPRSP